MVISEEKGQLEISESGSETYDSDDSEKDPTFSIEKTQSKFSKLSINKKTKPIKIKEMEEEEAEGDPDVEEIIIVPELDEKDQKSFEAVEKIIEAGQVEKLKVDQCKVYLRKHGLRLTGNKDILLERIKEHIDVVKNGGAKKYPATSFVVNCKGDACTGDVVMFEQNVYEMFSIASRSATGPPCGTRVIAGRIVKESYGAAKQQHTFTIEVLWSKGERPLPPLHPLLIKGRNLYRLKTMRQRWEDEGERQKQLMEKHTRGSVARSNREARIHEKETRKMLKTNRVPRPDNQIGKQEGKTKTSQSLHPISLGNPKIPPSSKASPHNTPTLFPNANMPLERVHQMPPLTSMNYNPHGYQQNINSNVPLKNMNYNPRGYAQNMNSNVPFERVHQRSPLTSLNNCNPSSSLFQGQGHERKQLCRFYAQGRCHYGDRCKYLHENIIIQSHDSERKNKHWHSNLRRYH